MDAVYWEVTHRCNLRCIYCALESGRGDDLPTDKMIRIAEEIGKAGVLEVSVSGGEPLLRRDLPEIVKTLVDWEVTPVLATNGTLIPEKEDVVSLFEAVYITLDGPEPVHNMQRGMYREVLRGMEMVRELGTPLFVNAVVTRHNWEYVEWIIEKALELGAEGIEVQGVVPVGRATPDLMASPEERKKVLEVVEKYRKKGVDVRASTLGTSFDCRAGETFAYVDYRGYLHPCPLLRIKNPRNVLQGFQYALDAPEMISVRQRDPKCSCPLKPRCRGGCRAMALALTGDLNGPDPSCLRMKI